ncbi:hypothetical protein F5Y10DRAFT_243195 [Nemania abortiva]|nr:hypothetical protein F5Y10DRAFT_243195 [Nemania abortiva]
MAPSFTYPVAQLTISLGRIGMLLALQLFAGGIYVLRPNRDKSSEAEPHLLQHFAPLLVSFVGLMPRTLRRRD